MNSFWEIKVLLVETNPTIIKMVEKIMKLSPVFYFLRRIENVHDLNYELKYNKPDLIISGLTMDNFDAGKVLELVNLFAEKIPVMVLAPEYNIATNYKLAMQGAYDIFYHSEIKRLPNEIAFLCERKNNPEPD